MLIGRPGSAGVMRLQNFLSRNGYPCTVLDTAADEEARALIERLGSAAGRIAGDGLSQRRRAEASRPMPRPACASASRLSSTPTRCTTWSWSALVRRALRRRFTRPPKAFGAGARPALITAVRRGRRRASRTISDFRPASRACAGRARLQPGAEVRRPGRHPAGGRASRLRRPGAAAARSAAARIVRRPQHPWPRRRDRFRRALPQPDIPNLPTSRAPGFPIGRPRSKPSFARARRSR